jgi:hypothetical protein
MRILSANQNEKQATLLAIFIFISIFMGLPSGANRNLAAKVKFSLMKNLILSLAFLFVCGSLFAQANDEPPTLEQTMATLTALYQLDDEQQEEMLVIQQRKYRNLGDIEDLRSSDPALFKKKLQSLHHGNIGHMHQLLNEEQLKVFRQKQMELRQQKADLFKALKGNGSQQAEIEKQMIELDLEALFQS